mgnify:CR=1 FL=1|tara:strand:- start:330 stop:752 length:423 start_codon:yes stop_codon:yes gene_type:complete
MIKYNLQCKNKHEFESWFSNSKEFEKLRSKKMIECIYCKSKEVEKSIMSPIVLNKEEKTKKEKSFNEFKKIQQELAKIRKFVEKNFENVGKDFPREVRNVYYDNRKNKNIYGEATPEETEELKEEGIEIASIPWVDKNKN